MTARADRTAAVQLHPFAQRRRIAPVVLLQRRHVGRRRRGRRPQQRLQHPLAAQHHRRPVGVGGHGQQARVAQQPVPAVVLPAVAAEPAAVDVRDAVVAGELLVQERVVRPQQLRDRTVPAHLTLEEQLRLPHHRAAQRVVEAGEQRAVRVLRMDVADLQPLTGEVVREPRGAAVRQQAPHLPGEGLGVAQAARLRQVEQLVVRDALPQEERQPRGQLQVAQRVDAARPRAGRGPLDAQQEARHREQGFEGALDARLEVAGGPAFAVDGQQRVDVGRVHRPAVGAPGQRREDLPRAGLLRRGAGRGGTADEDAPPARRVVRHGAVERSGDVERVDARQVGRHVRRGRRVGEAGGHEPRARADLRPEHQLAVRGHAVLVQPLPLDVVLRHRDQHARVRPREPAADVEAADQRVIDPQLDPVFVLRDAVDGLDGLVALQPDREPVLAVERERVAHRQPAVGGERHVLVAADVAALVAHLVDLRHRPVVRAADREAADLRGGGDIARHQRRGDRQHVGVVVEAEARHVARQQRLAVDLEVQQVPDRVDVLQPVQPPRGDPPRVRVGRRGVVERRFERAGEGVEGPRVGPRPPFRRHLPAAQLADHLLQGRGVAGDVAHVEAVEQQPGGPQPFVVAGHAVAVEQRAGRRLRRLGDGPAAGGGGRRGNGQDAERRGQSGQTRPTRDPHLRHGRPLLYPRATRGAPGRARRARTVYRRKTALRIAGRPGVFDAALRELGVET